MVMNASEEAEDDEDEGADVDTYGYLYELHVHSSLRISGESFGMGGALMREAKGVVARAGSRLMRLTCYLANKYAYKWYLDVQSFREESRGRDAKGGHYAILQVRLRGGRLTLTHTVMMTWH